MDTDETRKTIDDLLEQLNQHDNIPSFSMLKETLGKLSDAELMPLYEKYTKFAELLEAGEVQSFEQFKPVASWFLLINR